MRAPRSLLSPVLLAGLLAGNTGWAEPALPPPPTAVAIRDLFAPWKAPVPPRHLVDNLYYVGAAGVSSYLITTPEGHILIDTGFEETTPLILHGVEQLGFKPADIKFILSSHAHIDHVGGHALMKKLTGARVIASAADAAVMESGGEKDFITWPREMMRYTPVHVDRIISDGEQVRLGKTTLTAHLTPGHTRGATTWTMEVSDAGKSYHVVFFSSATINAGTRLLGNARYPEIATDLENTFARLKKLPCDIFLAPHGGQFAMAEKVARLDRGEGVAALVDPAGWQKLLAGAEQAYRDQLAQEKAVAK